MDVIHSSVRFNQGEEVERLFNMEGTNSDVIETVVYQVGTSENVFETSIVLVSDPSTVIGGLPLVLDLTINVAGIQRLEDDTLVPFSTISGGIGTIFQAPGKKNMLLGNLYSKNGANVLFYLNNIYLPRSM